jgi:hypothetical protein
MFDMSWIDLCWPDTPIELGATVAVVIPHLGFWSMNACRIVYLIEEHGSVEKHGFAYGTLPDHAEIGEERFTVEFNPEDQSVWYDLFAISRPTTLGLSLHQSAAEALRPRLKSSYAAGRSMHLTGAWTFIQCGEEFLDANRFTILDVSFSLQREQRHEVTESR